jgi:phosphoribosylaminoimidazole carboxylase PurE protein
MGSTSDLNHCEKIKKACGNFGIPCELRVTSAHKGPDETLRIKAEYEGDGIPTVFVAVAGRSNGLGPVLYGNTAYPVISCPPPTPDWGAQDVWSSLRLPSGKITESSKSFYSQASNTHNGRENNIMKFYIPVTQLQKFTSCCICSPLLLHYIKQI